MAIVEKASRREGNSGDGSHSRAASDQEHDEDLVLDSREGQAADAVAALEGTFRINAKHSVP